MLSCEVYHFIFCFCENLYLKCKSVAILCSTTRRKAIIMYMKNVETTDTAIGHHWAAASQQKKTLKVDPGECVQMYRDLLL